MGVEAYVGYSPEFKADALRLVAETDEPVAKIDHVVPPSFGISAWAPSRIRARVLRRCGMVRATNQRPRNLRMSRRTDCFDIFGF